MFLNGVVTIVNMASQPTEISYKVIILGDASVGKTSLLKRLIQDDFRSDEDRSVGVNVLKKNLVIDSQEITLTLWDVEEVSEIFKMEDFYFDGAKGIVIVYDVTNFETLKTAIKWCKRCTEHGLVHMPRILIGNKVDLTNERVVSKEEGDEIASKIHAFHFEASALKGENVLKAFMKIANFVYDLHGVI